MPMTSGPTSPWPWSDDGRIDDHHEDECHDDLATKEVPDTSCALILAVKAVSGARQK